MESRAETAADQAKPGSGESADHGGNHTAPWDAIRDGLGALGEVREYVDYYITAKLDAIKAGGRSILIYAVAGLLAVVFAAAFVGTSAVLLVLGAAHGIGSIFHRDWLGEIIVSAVVLLAIAAGLIVALKWLPSLMRKQLVSKYEARQRKQRTQFGRDVTQRARERSARSGA